MSFNYDPNGKGESDPDLEEVCGVLEGYKKKLQDGVITLIVAGEEFEFTPDEEVYIIRSAVLSRLHRIECDYLRDDAPEESYLGD